MGRSEINEQAVKNGFDALWAAKVSERLAVPKGLKSCGEVEA